MSTRIDPRPWYCVGAAVDEYKTILTANPDRLPMLKTFKILRALLVNVGILTFGAYAMYLGGEPTLIGLVTLLTFVGYNGLEASDYASLVRAVDELRSGGD